jgi:hypothetical protein
MKHVGDLDKILVFSLCVLFHLIYCTKFVFMLIFVIHKLCYLMNLIIQHVIIHLSIHN